MTQKLLIDGQECEGGVDVGIGRDVSVEHSYMIPDATYPKGSYLYKIGNEVQVATGYFATLYMDKPSFDWHGGPPFVMIDTTDWTWQASKHAAEKEEL